MQTVREKTPAPQRAASRPPSRWRNWLFYTQRVDGRGDIAPQGPGYVAAEAIWPSKDLAEMSWRSFERRYCTWMAINGIMYAGAQPEE